MGKHKKEHKHKHRERGGSQDDHHSEQEPPVLVPKLIVKLGSPSPSTDNREGSPAAPLLEQQGGLLDDQHHHHHHRHKEKKKKKKKDKKKSHEKDREHREHRHHHKSKKRKREHGEVGGENTVYSPPPPSNNLLPASLNSPSPLQGVSPSPEPAAKRQRLTSGDSASNPHLQSPRREMPSRSCVQKPPGPLGKILEYLLLMLEKKDLNNFFASPVSDTFAPGYSNIIKEAMDFSTMREKIDGLLHDAG